MLSPAADTNAAPPGRNLAISPSILVIILRGETRESDPHVARLQEYFATQPIFRVKMSKLSTNAGQATNVGNTGHNECQVITRVFDYITNSKYHNMPSLIIKDSSLIRISADKFTRIVERITAGVSRTDLFYLCVWNDKCNRQTSLAEVEEWDDDTTSWHRSVHPTSTQAIIYTPRARQVITSKLRLLNAETHDLGSVLNDMIIKRTLTNAIVDPNIVDFDMALITSNRNYERRNRCLTTPILTDVPEQEGMAGAIILIVLVFAVIIIAYIVMRRLTRRPLAGAYGNMAQQATILPAS